MTSNNPQPDWLRYSCDPEREPQALERLRTIEEAAYRALESCLEAIGPLPPPISEHEAENRQKMEGHLKFRRAEPPESKFDTLSCKSYLRASFACMRYFDHIPEYGARETKWKLLRAVHAIETYEETFSRYDPPPEEQMQEFLQVLEWKAAAAERELQAAP